MRGDPKVVNEPIMRGIGFKNSSFMTHRRVVFSTFSLRDRRFISRVIRHPFSNA